MIGALKSLGQKLTIFFVYRNGVNVGQIKGIVDNDDVGKFVDTTNKEDVHVNDTLIDDQHNEYTVSKVNPPTTPSYGIPIGGVSFKIYYVDKAKTPQPLINNIVNINNTNTVEIENNIDATAIVQVVQNEINNMTALSDEETKFALEKVNELAEIIKSKENRKSKWSKVASVFKWLADKSIDLACAFSPLIMQALQCLH